MKVLAKEFYRLLFINTSPINRTHHVVAGVEFSGKVDVAMKIVLCTLLIKIVLRKTELCTGM